MPQVQQISQRELRRYFYSSSKLVVACIICSAICFATSLWINSFHVRTAINLGVINFFVGGAFVLFAIGIQLYKTGGLTDEQYEKWQEGQRSVLLQIALRRLNLEAAYVARAIEPPVVISGFVREDAASANSYLAIREKRGKDKRWHYSIHTHVFIFLTQDRLIIFKGEVDALNPNEYIQDVYYYYYSHVVGFSLLEFRVAFQRVKLLYSGFKMNLKRKRKKATLKFQEFAVNIDNGSKVALETSSKIEIFNAKGKREYATIDEFERFDSILNNLTMRLYYYKQANIPVHP